MLSVLDLFSGIGGFSLGLERAGMRTVAFCEIDPRCRLVLAKHWPGVPCYDDVRTLTAERLRADGIPVDVICGGFPCQDLSVAGKGAGLAGERSGLWREFSRLAGELRPSFVIVENVAALLGRGLGTVLGDLAALGYDAEWHCIPAAAVGAPHRRDRVWIVAHPARERERPGRGEPSGVDRGGVVVEGPASWCYHLDCGPHVADTDGGDRNEGRPHHSSECAGGSNAQRGAGGAHVANTDVVAGHEGRTRHAEEVARGRHADRGDVDDVLPNAHGARLAQRQGFGCRHGPELTTVERNDWWAVEPDVGRVADGIPARVDRLTALGNAVVPQIPELIGRAIVASLPAREAAAD